MKRHKEKTTLELRKFGEVMALILFVLSAVSIWRGRTGYYLTLPLGVTFLTLGILIPQSLSKVEKIWTQIGEKLSTVMSIVILAITFYAVIFPIGFLMRIMRGGSMKLRIDRNANTYWEPSDHKGSGSRYTKPY